MWRGLKSTSAGLNHWLRWQRDTPIATSTPSARASSTPPAGTTSETTSPAVRRSGSGWRRISRWGGRGRGLKWRARSCFCARTRGIRLVGSRSMLMGGGFRRINSTSLQCCDENGRGVTQRRVPSRSLPDQYYSINVEHHLTVCCAPLASEGARYLAARPAKRPAGFFPLNPFECFRENPQLN